MWKLKLELLSKIIFVFSFERIFTDMWLFNWTNLASSEPVPTNTSTNVLGARLPGVLKSNFHKTLLRLGDAKCTFPGSQPHSICFVGKTKSAMSFIFACRDVRHDKLQSFLIFYGQADISVLVKMLKVLHTRFLRNACDVRLCCTATKIMTTRSSRHGSLVHVLLESSLFRSLTRSSAR